MFSNRRLLFRSLGAIACVACASTSLNALNTSTHRLINIAAAATEQFDGELRNALGLPNGRATEVTAQDGVRLSISNWLGLGGIREDDGVRFRNHFHNPLKPWAEAGLPVAGHNSSSVQWMQDPNQNWGWKDARELHKKALTTADPRGRAAAAADLFRALGQIMHLVVDASVPEHTRSDPHPGGSILDFLGVRAGNYEYWVSEQHAGNKEADFIARYLSNPIGFDSSILQIPVPPGESVATVSIARLIDTDRYEYNGPLLPNPNVTLGGAIGLAEFSNANFFSENTLNGTFPFPRRQGLTPTPQVAPHGSHVRAYLAKPAGQGLPTTVALAECVTERSVEGSVASITAPYPCVDEAVWQETARHMLPRAVGYARGVLDYFFRGKLRAEFLTYLVDPPGAALLPFVNESGESMSGHFGIYSGGTSEHRQPASAWYVNVNTDPWSIYSGATFSLAPGEAALAVVAAPPLGVTHHMVVFEGRLGLEENAVASDAVVFP